MLNENKISKVGNEDDHNLPCTSVTRSALVSVFLKFQIFEYKNLTTLASLTLIIHLDQIEDHFYLSTNE